MAQFQPALRFTLQDEGGYAHTPGDKGGETYEGIARNFWPKWAGWDVIDAAKADPSFPRNLAGNAQLPSLVNSFYVQHGFWQMLYGQITSQSIATKLFDEDVNMGVKHGVECLQQAVGVLADGGFGPKTLAGVNAQAEAILLPAFVQVLVARYRAIVAGAPGQAKFLPEWLKRANRLP